MTIEEMLEKKKELGLTNKDIAERSGLSLPTVQRILSGATKKPQGWNRTLIEAALMGMDSSMVREVPEFAYMAKQQGEYTIEDYFKFPEERRCEIIDGVIYDMSSPTVDHQEVVGELFYQLISYVKQNKGKCKVFFSPLDCALEEQTVVQPDVLISCDPGRRDLIDNPLPDFVAEVISPSTRKKDYLIKLEKYRKNGVREYWIVDQKKEKITVYLFDGDFDIKIYGLYDKIPVGIWDGKCVIDLGQIKEDLS